MGAGKIRPRAKSGDRREPRDPKVQSLRKLFVGNMHSATTLASMQSYFEKFGEVEHCYMEHYGKKETNKCKGYSFVAFTAVATADEVQRTRPHTLMDLVVNTKCVVPKEWRGSPEAEMRSKKLYIAGLHGPKSGLNEDTSDSDLEEYFGKYGKVVGVSQKRERGSGKKKGFGYIEFSDEDPVDRAVLVEIYNIKTAVFEVKRGLSRGQQEEAKMKREQQEQTGGQTQGASAGRSPEALDPALDLEQGPPGAGALKSKSFQEQEHPVRIRRPPTPQPEDAQEANLRKTHKMGTEEGSKELRATAEAKAGPCPVCKENFH